MATAVSDVVDADGVADAMVCAMAVHVAIIAIATPMSNVRLKGFKLLATVMVHKKHAASASTLKRQAAATVILERLVVAVCGQ